MADKIYVVVRVSFEYYRIQKNLYASTDKDKCLDFITKCEEYIEETIPIFDYAVGSPGHITLEDCAEPGGETHYWVQEL